MAFFTLNFERCIVAMPALGYCNDHWRFLEGIDERVVFFRGFISSNATLGRAAKIANGAIKTGYFAVAAPLEC